LTCDEIRPGTSDLICECSPNDSTGVPPLVPQPQQPRLVWSDEFDGDGIDLSKWTLVNSGGGFGNRELQFYTGRESNARVEQGLLKISAKCERYSGHDFTSAKLQTKNKGDWGPGHRVEVRARLPKGRGTWPAIWMLPTQSAYGSWPKSGEIDIMEAVGCTANKVHGTVHTGAYNHMLGTQQEGHTFIEVGDWHTYMVEWTESKIDWFVDGQHYHRFAAASSPNSDKWPFNQDFFLILNLAIGGTWGGWCVSSGPSCNSPSEMGVSQTMEVDYARVYAL